MALQKGTIQWFLANMPPTNQQEQPDQRPFKQPRLERVQQQPTKVHLALSSTNHCQQLYAQELGWRCPASLNTWHQAQQHQLSCICLKASHTPAGFRTGLGAKTSPVVCLDLQHGLTGGSASGLVAVGDSFGRLHICRASQLWAASASALNAAAALPPDVREALLEPTRWARRAMAAEGVPTGSGNIPTAPAAASPGNTGVLSLDTQEQLRSCCWLQQRHNGAGPASSSSEGVLVTSGGRNGLTKRVFAEGRQAASSLRAKGGSMVEAAGMAVALEAQAAYHLAAVSARSLLLWDLRGGPAAAAQLPLQAVPSVLRALPGGEVLLTAEHNGQVCLYDVRRLSSSSIVNFGSSRSSQQLLMTHNLKSRAQAAGHGSGSCTMYGVACEPQFLCDVVVNPVDPTLLAYIKPQLQVGLFDLFTGKVLQQVPLLEVLGESQANTGSSSGGGSSGISQATAGPLSGLLSHSGAQGCWDSSGRVLYAQGVVQFSSHVQAAGGDAAVDVSASLAAVDFGSWHGRKQRWAVSSSSSIGASTSDDQAAADGHGDQEMSLEDYEGPSGGLGDAETVSRQEGSSSRQRERWRGQRHLCQGGQVMHRELHSTAAPTVMAAAGSRGEMMFGTQSGDVLCLA